MKIYFISALWIVFYRTIVFFILITAKRKRKSASPLMVNSLIYNEFIFFCRDERIRTSDPTPPRRVL